jgi:hypothetical protein
MVMVYDKINDDEWMTSVVGHFDGHGSAPGQYRQHRLMRHVQGYSGSHWTPASGDYLLHIAPAAARATGIQQQSTNTPAKMAILMAKAMRRYVTTRIPRWRRSRASLEATGRRHWASIMPDNMVGTWLRHFFLMFSSSKP